VFGRNEAPYISVPSIQGQGDTIVLLSGMIPNIKGQPVVEDWFGIVFDKMDFKEVISINEFMDRTGLGKRELPNPQTPVNEHKVKRVLPESLEIGKQEILRARERYKQRINPQIMEQIEKLKILENRQYQFTEGSLYGKSRKEREFRRIARNFAEYTDWIKKTLNCGEDPFLRVICMVQEAE
jgi:hypothetical protein